MPLPISLPTIRFRRPAVLLVLCLAACARPEKPPYDSVLIAPNVTLSLPKPSALGMHLDLDQLASAHYGTGQTIAFESRVRLTPTDFRLVALDPVGRKAFDIVWTDTRIDFVPAPWLPKSLKPENVLADIVLTYWPEAAVRQALAASGATVLDDPHGRSIQFQGQEIIHIDHEAGGEPWSGHWHYRNLVWKYDLDIQSVRLSPGNTP